MKSTKQEISNLMLVEGKGDDVEDDEAEDEAKKPNLRKKSLLGRKVSLL